MSIVKHSDLTIEKEKEYRRRRRPSFRLAVRDNYIPRRDSLYRGAIRMMSVKDLNHFFPMIQETIEKKPKKENALAASNPAIGERTLEMAEQAVYDVLNHYYLKIEECQGYNAQTSRL